MQRSLFALSTVIKNKKQNCMLERISWSAYWTFIVVVLAIYYLILFVLLYQKGFFFKNRVKTIPSPSGKQEPSNQQPNLFGFQDAVREMPGDQNTHQLPVDDKILMPLVHDLIQGLKVFITDISERSYVKEEIIMGIQVIINNYKRLEDSPYHKSINDFIKNECEDFCSIHLSEEDIRRIWLG